MTSDRSAWGSGQTQFFFSLTPDKVLEAVESSGLRCTGRCQALNSFENRVYDVEVESEDGDERPRRVVKFYRPGRWSEAQILDEHAFLSDLAEAEIPAVGPLPFPDGRTLRAMPESGIWFAVFPRVGGRAPDELDDEACLRVGRLIGRIHNVGAKRAAPHRVRLGPETYGISNLEFLLAGNWIAQEVRSRYEAAVRGVCALSSVFFAGAEAHRVHGDCHLGNLLFNAQGAFFVDFDDMVTAPAVQDLWLLIPGADAEGLRKRNLLFEGYEEMRQLDRAALRWIEALRALRFVHYSAWIARRWEDPAFPRAFPQFGSERYWAQETQDMENQLRAVQEAAG
jgi:Ser/Thr protein kinase RdoA (MazF antagonist)